MAVAPIHGKGIRPLVDEKDLSPFLREVTVSSEMEPAEVTTFGNNDKNYIPGLKDATFAFDGIFSAGDTGSTTPADDIAEFLDTHLGSTNLHVVTVDMTRSTGGRALMMKTLNTSYDTNATVSDVTTIAVDAQASEGYYGGVMLRPLSAANTTEANSGVLHKGSTIAGGTTGGGIGHFHLTAQTTLDSLTVKIQHSTSGSTWADLISFTAATEETFQRSTVAGAVKEQTRASVTSFTTNVGGSDDESATFAVAFARKH